MHIGELGQEMTVPLTLVFKLDCSNEKYEKWLHKLVDEWGNIVTWWGGHQLRYADTPEVKGEIVKPRDVIVATFKVKEHIVYYEDEETVVTRLRQDQTAEQVKTMRRIRKQRREVMIRAGICLKCEGTQIRHGKPCRHCEGGW